MIPLNKPGDIRRFEREGALARAIAGARKEWLFTAGDGLCLIYRELYKQHGPLRVAVSPLTCYQAIYPIVMNGHIPELVDIDRETLNIDVTKIPDDVDAVELIHLGGCPVGMNDKLKEKIVIEDCVQAMGAKWKGQYVGTMGQYSVYSMLKNLYQPMGLVLGVDTKIDSVGVDRFVRIYKVVKTWLEMRASYRKSILNGIYGSLLRLRENEGGFRNVVRGVWATNEMEESLQYIEALNQKRVENAERVIAALNPEQFAVQQVPEGGEPTWNRILVRSLVRPAQEVIKEWRAAGIAANNLTQSYIHPWQEPIWNDLMLAKYYHAEQLPIYSEVVEQVVAIPNSPFLSDEEIRHMENVICKMENVKWKM